MFTGMIVAAWSIEGLGCKNWGFRAPVPVKETDGSGDAQAVCICGVSRRVMVVVMVGVMAMVVMVVVMMMMVMVMMVVMAVVAVVAAACHHLCYLVLLSVHILQKHIQFHSPKVQKQKQIS